MISLKNFVDECEPAVENLTIRIPKTTKDEIELLREQLGAKPVARFIRALLTDIVSKEAKTLKKA